MSFTISTSLGQLDHIRTQHTQEYLLLYSSQIPAEVTVTVRKKDFSAFN